MSLDLTKPVQTRDGRKVILDVTKADGSYPLRGAADRSPMSWTATGKWSRFFDQHLNDLVNIPVPEPVHTIESLDAEGFNVVIDTANDDHPRFQYRVSLTRDGAYSVGRGASLAAAIAEALMLHKLSTQRDYSVLLYIFSDGSCGISNSNSLGRAIASKRVRFSVSPGEFES